MPRPGPRTTKPRSVAEAVFPLRPTPELERTRCRKCGYMLVRGTCAICSAQRKKPKGAA